MPCPARAVGRPRPIRPGRRPRDRRRCPTIRRSCRSPSEPAWAPRRLTAGRPREVSCARWQPLSSRRCPPRHRRETRRCPRCRSARPSSTLRAGVPPAPALPRVPGAGCRSPPGSPPEMPLQPHLAAAPPPMGSPLMTALWRPPVTPKAAFTGERAGRQQDAVDDQADDEAADRRVTKEHPTNWTINEARKTTRPRLHVVCFRFEKPHRYTAQAAPRDAGARPENEAQPAPGRAGKRQRKAEEGEAHRETLDAPPIKARTPTVTPIGRRSTLH